MESSKSRTTITQHKQQMVEFRAFQSYNLFSSIPKNAKNQLLEIDHDTHMEYLMKGLNQLPSSFSILDANRPWLCYWILHSIALLGESIECEKENNVVDFLSRCQDSDGGYAGGPGQANSCPTSFTRYFFSMPHLATTYAAVNSLITLGGERALSSINRQKLHSFLLRMKDSSGGFRMHNGGEMDVRACYTAVSVASVLNILDSELVQDLGSYILSCQTYEGGIAGEPGLEAHGGYTFCGLATMILINEAHRLDLPSLIDWVVFRQGVECGFQGRTNKLVDGCYSFWQGDALALVQRLSSVVSEQMKLMSIGEKTKIERITETISTHNFSEKEKFQGPSEAVKFTDIGFSFLKRHTELGPLFNSLALQQYILICSQVQDGGFRDKLGEHRDYYHTCYCLSGLSVSQYCCSNDADTSPLPKALFGPYSNLLEPIHPLFNIVVDSYDEAHKFFSGLASTLVKRVDWMNFGVNPIHLTIVFNPPRVIMAEAKPEMRKPVFTKIEQLRPGTSGHTLTVKVVSTKMVLQKGRSDGPQLRQVRIAECLIGDETGIIVFTARNDQVDLMKTGATVILRNAKIDMFKGSMRLAVDKWGRVEVTEPASFTVKEDNNLSLVEYELVNVVEE
ncbi:hypothetical protein GIB67_004309 [Kingdonia uniflora]|uniref:Protein farnesyltransferase subunit beta n=1 Tax=Kingdonia uniflora TaxID=39325 RepID=A0A7J7MR48_9MAGN|nr:hypothetical protein GIB67_004309 [Kingdonia uniflora]